MSDKTAIEWTDATWNPVMGSLPELPLEGIAWVIVGGESGPRRRPMDPAWVREIRDQCEAAGVRFFFKQWGGLTPKAGGCELDGREWKQWPRVVMAQRETGGPCISFALLEPRPSGSPGRANKLAPSKRGV